MRIRNLIILLCLCITGIFCFTAFSLFGNGKDNPANFPTFNAKKMDMQIDILESGTVEASESLVIRSKIQGSTKILFIVPEGTYITEEDVANKKLLVRLESGSLEDSHGQQEISCQTALAEYTNDKEQVIIRKKLNESAEKTKELDVKFSLMDLQKYVGEELAQMLVDRTIEVTDLITHKNIGGEMLQKIQELKSEIDLAKEEETRAKVKLEWTKKLEAKGYVSRDDLQADQLALKQKEFKLEKAKTKLELFEKYDYIKQAAKFLSDYEENITELERTKAKNRSELTRAEVRAKSSKSKYDRHMQQLEKIEEQIENCEIYATQPGLVVYGGGEGRRWRNNDPIGEGTDVSERQEIIKIPNTEMMVVKCKIHESVISNVKKGQRAVIKIDAIPDKSFRGEVSKVGVVPDSQNSWLNPDLKVYKTEITILGDFDIKPGLSANAQIIVKEIPDALVVPINAVISRENQSFVYVVNGSSKDKRIVETGEYNDKFIQILNGLSNGEEVVLNSPSAIYGGETEDKGGSKKSDDKSSDKVANI